MYPGQFPNIRLNIFNVVLVLDLSQTSALQFITGSISSIISRNFPFRFGVVPIMETEEGKSLCWILCDVIFIAYIASGSQMARLFYYLIENYGRTTTMIFLRNVCCMYNYFH